MLSERKIRISTKIDMLQIEVDATNKKTGTINHVLN